MLYIKRFSGSGGTSNDSSNKSNGSNYAGAGSIRKILRRLGGFGKDQHEEYDKQISQFYKDYGDSVENIHKSRSKFTNEIDSLRSNYDDIQKTIASLDANKNRNLIDVHNEDKKEIMKKISEIESNLREFDSKFAGKNISEDINLLKPKVDLERNAYLGGKRVLGKIAGGAIGGGGLGYGLGYLATRDMDPEKDKKKIRGIRIGSAVTGAILGGAFTGRRGYKQESKNRHSELSKQQTHQ